MYWSFGIRAQSKLPRLRKKEKNMAALKYVGVILLVGFLCVGAYQLTTRGEFPSVANKTQAPSIYTGNLLIDEALDRLIGDSTTQQKRLAASYLGTQESVSSNLIRGMQKAIDSNSDPAVRASVAEALGQLAVKDLAGSREIQLLELIRNAYQQEPISSVRRNLVQAAAKLKTPEAATFIARAAEKDPDSEVRAFAKQAMKERERHASDQEA